jgi:hypothetical protein
MLTRLLRPAISIIHRIDTGAPEGISMSKQNFRRSRPYRLAFDAAQAKLVYPAY